MLYNVQPWNVVTAYDARTGRVLWSYDPQVPLRFGRLACCDIVSRGLAAWQGKIYVATLDGRLIALDAATGRPVWSVLTVDNAKGYTITGAPRVFDGKVLIGNGGAEIGVRGYVSAYDAETGEQLWRFHTVPGNPADGFENAAMEMAAATWTGEWWKRGGGGTVWDIDRLRSRARPRLHRHRQRLAVGAASGAARAAATTCSSPRSSRSRPTPANTAGTTRPCPARSGTTPPPSR